VPAIVASSAWFASTGLPRWRRRGSLEVGGGLFVAVGDMKSEAIQDVLGRRGPAGFTCRGAIAIAASVASGIVVTASPSETLLRPAKAADSGLEPDMKIGGCGC